MCDKCQITDVVPMNPREDEPLSEEAIDRGMQALNQLVVDHQKRDGELTAIAISHDQPPN
ncbi:MAG: hypothetical protein Q8O59_02595 [bacterium]|nr:hypothetical protein [bacterium]